jgi:ketosteroid isomerase-like protein
MTDEQSKQSRNKEIVRAAFERWSNGTGSGFDLLHPDVRWTIVGSSPISGTYGKQDLMEKVTKPFLARLKGPVVPTVHGIYADGDAVIVLYDATGIATDGIPYSNRYAWFLEMKDGMIIKGTAFFDTRDYDALWARVAP